MLVVFALLALVVLMLGTMFTRLMWMVLPVLALGAWLFHSLTIQIADGELRWRFGSGVIRKSVPMDQILTARVVRTNVLEGWGIHFSRFGWLYNVSGFDAVAIELREGKKFCLGTNDPGTLVKRLILPTA